MWQVAESKSCEYPRKLTIENCPPDFFRHVVRVVTAAARSAGEANDSLWMKKTTDKTKYERHCFTSMAANRALAGFSKLKPDNPRLNAGFENLRIDFQGNAKFTAGPTWISHVEQTKHGLTTHKLEIQTGVATIPKVAGARPIFFSGYPMFDDALDEEPNEFWRVLPNYDSFEKHVMHFMADVVERATEHFDAHAGHRCGIPDEIREAAMRWKDTSPPIAKLRETWHHPGLTKSYAGIMPDHEAKARKERAARLAEARAEKKRKAQASKPPRKWSRAKGWERKNPKHWF